MPFAPLSPWRPSQPLVLPPLLIPPSLIGLLVPTVYSGWMTESMFPIMVTFDSRSSDISTTIRSQVTSARIALLSLSDVNTLGQGSGTSSATMSALALSVAITSHTDTGLIVCSNLYQYFFGLGIQSQWTSSRSYQAPTVIILF